jgi:hypothetical protein
MFAGVLLEGLRYRLSGWILHYIVRAWARNRPANAQLWAGWTDATDEAAADGSP